MGEKTIGAAQGTLLVTIALLLYIHVPIWRAGWAEDKQLE